MTTAEDIKTLREAEHLFAIADPKFDYCERKALAILCRVASSLMAGEGEKGPEALGDSWTHVQNLRLFGSKLPEHFENPFIPQMVYGAADYIVRQAQAIQTLEAQLPTPSSGEFERGWNAALIHARARLQLTTLYDDDCKPGLDAAARLVSALRKPLQQEQGE